MEVKKLDDCIGEEVERAVSAMKPKDVVLWKTSVFTLKKRKRQRIRQEIGFSGRHICERRFRAAHRAHASTAGIAEFIPAYAGLLMEKEVEAQGKLLSSPGRPLQPLSEEPRYRTNWECLKTFWMKLISCS